MAVTKAKRAEEVKPKTQDDFVKAYNALCVEYGFRVDSNLSWVKNHDGTFSTKVELQVIDN